MSRIEATWSTYADAVYAYSQAIAANRSPAVVQAIASVANDALREYNDAVDAMRSHV